MTVGTPSWLAASGGLPTYDATELRAIDTMYTTYDGHNLGARPGVRPGGTSGQVTVSGMTWTVAVGIVGVSGVSNGAYGEYRVPIISAETGAIPARDATFDRKDIVVVQVFDAENGDGTREAKVVYLVGQPSTTPAAPSVPLKATLLATLTVPKASPGNPVTVLDGRQQTVAAGGVLPTPVRPTNAYPGMVIYRTDTGLIERYNGTEWSDILGDDLTPYAPNWRNGSGGAQLAIGNGTIEGRYQKRGKMIEGTVMLLRGSTTNVGSADYIFDVPETPRNFRTLLGGGYVSRGGVIYTFTVQGIGGTAFALVDTQRPGARIAFNNPTGWTTNDFVTVWFQYEVN